jgi:DNA-binding transcriptional LysR family regulator
MRIESVYVFVKLAENHCDFSIHKMLDMPRSTMWSAISDLEKSLGKKLINRKKQSLSFTAAGEEFIPFARKLYQTYEESLDSTLHAEDSHVGGDLIISATLAMAHLWYMDSIKEVFTKYPKLRLHITSSDAITREEENASDILIRPFADSDTFERQWFISYHHGLFASPEYLEKMGIPTTPEDLVNHRIIGYGEHKFSYFDDINWHLKGYKSGLPKLKPFLSVNSTKGIFDAAKYGLGICSAPYESNKFYEGNLIRILPDIQGPTIRTYFSINKSATGRKLNNINTFKDYFEEYVRNLGVTINPVDSKD